MHPDCAAEYGSFGVAFMIEEVVGVNAPCGSVDAVHFQLHVVEVGARADGNQIGTDIIFNKVEFGSEQHAVETEAETLARAVIAGEQFV